MFACKKYVKINYNIFRNVGMEQSKLHNIFLDNQITWMMYETLPFQFEIFG